MFKVKDKGKEIAKIANPEEAFWIEIQKKTEQEIKTLENMLRFNKAILDMCMVKIAEANK